MLTVPNASEVVLLDAATGKTAPTAWTLRLYTAISSALGNGTVTGHLTEAVGGGYAGISLPAASWTTTAGSPTQSVQPAKTFTFTGALTGNPSILGYYITRADGTLILAEPLASSFTPTTSGDSVSVTPQITLGSIAND